MPSSSQPGGMDGQPLSPPYLALLLVGFTLPRTSPSWRWALTSPFHPCRKRRCIFCGTFPGVAPGLRYRPPCPAEPGLSSGCIKINQRSHTDSHEIYL